MATVSDVRDLIDTDLSDSEIQSTLDFTSRDINRSYTSDDFESSAHRDDFEAALTAFRIVSGRDRRPASVSLGNASKSYDQHEVDYLRGLVRRLDPGTAFSVGGPRRTTDRHIRTATGRSRSVSAGSSGTPHSDRHRERARPARESTRLRLVSERLIFVSLRSVIRWLVESYKAILVQSPLSVDDRLNSCTQLNE